MKRLLYILAFLPLVVSCGEKVQPDVENVPLSIDRQSLTFAAEGGTAVFNVKSQTNPDITSWERWYELSKGKWESQSVAVTVKVPANPTAEERTGKIAVVCGDEKKYVEVSQAAGTGSPGGDEDEGGDDGSEGGDDGPETPAVPVPGDNAAWTMARKLGMGWNLGNHFDAHNNGVSGETAWGNPKATQATFNKVKAAGFSTVRIPVTWLGHIGAAPEYKIEEAWLDRVAEVVGYAEKAGLNAVLNMHHDGADSKFWLNIKSAAADPSVHQQILEQVSAMWGQIAAKFRDKGDFLIFEAFNEIHDGGWGWGANRNDGGKQYRCLNEWNQAFVDAVRAAGGENAGRILGIPAYCTNVDISLESFVMPDDTADDRLMMSVHCYDPYDYTLPASKSEWGHTADPSKKVAGDNEADLRKNFEKLHTHYVSKGIPVYFGEFGCVNRATLREQKFQQYYLKYFAKLAKIYGVPSFIWDNGAKGAGNERHAFLDHGTGEYCSSEAEAAIKAMIGSYGDGLTLEQVYDNAPL